MSPDYVKYVALRPSKGKNDPRWGSVKVYPDEILDEWYSRVKRKKGEVTMHEIKLSVHLL